MFSINATSSVSDFASKLSQHLMSFDKSYKVEISMTWNLSEKIKIHFHKFSTQAIIIYQIKEVFRLTETMVIE